MEISDQTTCLDPYFASFEESLSSRNYKPETLTNYRYLPRRFGGLLDIEGIAPSALTPDLAVELGRRLPTTPKSQIKIPNLARLFVAHLIVHQLSALGLRRYQRRSLRDRITALRTANIYERQSYRHIVGLPVLGEAGADGIAAETPFLVVCIMRDCSPSPF
jgi:hypothetical protein